MMPVFERETMEQILSTQIDAVTADVRVKVIDVDDLRYAVVNTARRTDEPTVQIFDRTTPKRDHKIGAVADVIGFAISYQENFPVIWIGDDTIEITFEATPERVKGDKAVYHWSKTPEWRLFEELAKARSDSAFDQKALRKLIRQTLWDSFKSDSDRTDLLKSLAKVTLAESIGAVQGKGTYEAALTGGDGAVIEWPERLALVARVFEDDSLPQSYDVDAVFDVDAAKKTFSIWPTVSSLNRAVLAVKAHPAELIREGTKTVDTIRVFTGEPNLE